MINLTSHSIYIITLHHLLIICQYLLFIIIQKESKVYLILCCFHFSIPSYLVFSQLDLYLIIDLEEFAILQEIDECCSLTIPVNLMHRCYLFSKDILSRLEDDWEVQKVRNYA